MNIIIFYSFPLLRPTKKLIVWGFPTDPSSNPQTLNLFFNFQKKIEKKKKKKKINKEN